MIWEQLIDTYNNRQKELHVCPIAHTQITARIGIFLGGDSRILAAAKIRQSVFAPCTAQSECRVNNTAPHLVCDNASYVAGIDPDRGRAYMEQLSEFAAETGDPFCRSVLKYLRSGTILDDVRPLADLENRPKTVITFAVDGIGDSPENPAWTDYYLRKLPKNGLCAITGTEDYIPDAYPRIPLSAGGLSRLFCARRDPLDSMPDLRPGYTASQKIIHTLQALSGSWEEQGKIGPDDTIVYRDFGT